MTSEASGTIEFLGFRFNSHDTEAALTLVLGKTGEDSFTYLVTPNVDHVVQISRVDDPLIAHAYAIADFTLCDSRILQRLAKWSGLMLHLAPGSDLTARLLSAAQPGLRIAVVGGDPALHRAISALFPQFDWQFHQPPMGLRRDPAARLQVVNFVEDAGADLIFFAVGAPQSEMVCSEIKQRGKARGMALCIGASLEFLTGAKHRAPLWMQRRGLEWLFRLVSEPGRLWRRYLVEGPQIFLIWRRWIKADHLRAGSGSNPSGGA